MNLSRSPDNAKLAHRDVAGIDASMHRLSSPHLIAMRPVTMDGTH